MAVFDFRFQVNAPLDDVRHFHRDTRALKRLTPPPVFVQLHEIEPLAENSIARFTLWLGPIPIRWTAQHKNVTQSQFTDVQTKGPMRQWEHTHRFEPVTDTETIIHEHIEYEHPPGLRGLATRLLFGKPALWGLFCYRRFVTRWNLRKTGNQSS